MPRTREEAYPPGHYVDRYGTTRYGGQYYNRSTINQDSGLGFRQDEPLNISHLDYCPGRINGTSMIGDTLYGTFTNYATSLPTGYFSFPAYDLAALSNEVVAKTNPSTPALDLPLFIFELKDLPRMIRMLGNVMHQYKMWRRYPRVPSANATAVEVANWNLAWQYGWKPMVSDLSRMIGFSRLVDKRMRRLQRLARGQVLKKALDTQTLSLPDKELYVSAAARVDCLCRRKETGTRKIWGYSKWSLPTSDIFASSTALRDYASKQVVNLIPNPSTAWEALPWSWFFDWFSDFGSYIEAKRGNTIGCHLEKVRICIQTELNSKYPLVSIRPGATYSPGYVKRVYKERKVGYLSPINASLPILSEQQWGIVSSLAVQRLGRR